MPVLLAQDEKELLQRLRESDETSLTLLYKAYWQPLFLAAYNVLKDKKASEDIVQEIFLQLWLKRENLIIRESLMAYLSTAVRYQVFHCLRKTAKGSRLQEAAETTPLAESPDEVLLQKDLYGRVREVVNELPEKCRQVYRLSREEQLSHKEIAGQLNISIKTVENQLTIALRRVRHYLQASSIISMFWLSLHLLP